MLLCQATLFRCPPCVGGLRIDQDLKVIESGFTVQDCHARRGGAISVLGSAHFHELRLQHNSANMGGCVHSGGDLVVDGPVHVMHCLGSVIGGGLNVGGRLKFQNGSFEGCQAPSGAAFSAEGQVTFARIDIVGASLGAEIMAGGGLDAQSLRCINTTNCRVQGPKLHVERLFCARGKGREDHSGWIGCEPCDEAYTKLRSDLEICQLCPEIAGQNILCKPTRLAVPPGVMARPSDCACEAKRCKSVLA